MSRRESLRAFVDESPFRMTMLDNDATILAVSDAVLEVLRASRGAVVGRHADDVFGRTQEEDWRELAKMGAYSLKPTRVELPTGVRWVQSEGAPWRNEAGEIGGVIQITRDVTAQQKAVQELRRTEALLDAIVDSIPSLLTVHSGEGAFRTWMNRAAHEFFGVEPGAARSGPPTCLSESNIRTHLARIEVARNSGGIDRCEEQFTNANGQTHDFDVLRRLIEDRDGGKHVVVLAHDITERQRAARALEQALVEAKSANRAKSAFLATVSHEIRTPLNGVLGMAQAMARDELSTVQRSRLEVIRQSGEALLAILNDVLDLSKIEAGKLELESIAFDLGQVVRSAAAGFVAPAAAKGLELVLDVGEVEGFYKGDPTRVRQVLSNLLSNAVKFTDAGEVRVTGSHDAEGVAFSVTDTGPGIASTDMERLFEKFVQVDSSTTRRYGGSGLGLPICRELANLMGGSISAASVLGQGARFTLDLPLSRLEDAAAPVPAEDCQAEPLLAPQELQILAAEDNPVNQQVLRTIFDQIGVPITIVGDGVAAVEAVRERAWDIILMDVQMPVLDGVAATQIIREFEAKSGRRRTPIIALTANVMQHQKADYVSSGMDQVVAKPLQIAQLFSAIDELVREAPDYPEREQAAG